MIGDSKSILGMYQNIRQGMRNTAGQNVDQKRSNVATERDAHLPAKFIDKKQAPLVPKTVTEKSKRNQNSRTLDFDSFNDFDEHYSNKGMMTLKPKTDGKWLEIKNSLPQRMGEAAAKNAEQVMKNFWGVGVKFDGLA